MSAKFKLAGQFGLAAAITLALAAMVGFCSDHFANVAPHEAHPPKLVSATLLPTLLLTGVSALLLAVGLCVFLAALIEKLGTRSRDQKTTQPNAAMGGGKARRVQSDIQGPA